MIYVTGDLHGDPARLSDKALRRLKKGDILLVCGDFGFVWDGSPAELKLRRKIGKQKYTTIFVDGTHDNLPMIREFPEEEYAGGTVRRIEGNLLYAERGTILTLEGKKVFFLGGGVSEDMDERLESGTWHSEEMPTAEELAAAEERLTQCSYTVKKQQHKLRTAYPTILYQSGAVTRKCCCSIFMPLK